MAHRQAPTAILAQAMRQFDEEEEQLPAFVASPKWQGARPGYYFSKGAQGVG